MLKCVICGNEFRGYGNRADPVAKGYCCDVCNMKVVVPERIKQSYKPKGANKDENRKNTSRTRR